MIKKLFIPAYRKTDYDINAIKLPKLPQNIAVAYSIQYKQLAFKIGQLLSKKHNITKIIQILGCSQPIFPKNTEAIILIGSGRFHAVSLSLNTKFPIYMLEGNIFSRISKEESEKMQKHEKAAYVNFLNSETVGILVTTKPGQQNLKNAIQLKKSIKNKDSYLFIANNIDVSEFENFSIQSWVNTACPRLDMNSSKIININKL
jgi:2-(3-amino-3-carboxypropyl)histidine synthase